MLSFGCASLNCPAEPTRGRSPLVADVASQKRTGHHVAVLPEEELSLLIYPVLGPQTNGQPVGMHGCTLFRSDQSGP